MSTRIQTTKNNAGIGSKGKVAEKDMKLGISEVPQSPSLSGNSRDAIDHDPSTSLPKRMRVDNDDGATGREEPKRPRAAPQRQASVQNKITDYLLHWFFARIEIMAFWRADLTC